MSEFANNEFEITRSKTQVQVDQIKLKLSFSTLTWLIMISIFLSGDKKSVLGLIIAQIPKLAFSSHFPTLSNNDLGK